ncbi:MAG: hypothetical protein GY778_11725, partial [bacterium]|nr:hypothetical protein [bacterium]
YVRNSLGRGGAAVSYDFGSRDDQPFAGDFDGDGIDTVGMYRPGNALVYYRNSHTPGLGENQFFYGIPGDRIVAGDWDGDGDDTVAVYRQSNGTLYVNLENNASASEYALWVGNFAAAVVSTGS